MTWPLPAGPADPLYQDLLQDLDRLPPEEAAPLFRAVCEDDFWFFVRHATTFGQLQIRDPGHPRLGGLWADDPFVFWLCREIQASLAERRDDVFWNLPRFYFKTELVTKNGSIWSVLKDPSLTVALITYKVDKTGEAMFDGIRAELKGNRRLIAHWPDVLADPLRGESYPKDDNRKLTVKRPLGPKEPTFSVHALNNLPNSGHFRRIVVDDASVQESVSNPQMIEDTYRNMQRVAMLGHDDTLTHWVGTIWDQHDAHMKALKTGLFQHRIHVPAFAEDGSPVLRSRGFLGEWRRKMGEYEFAAQMLGKPVAKGEQHFRLEWLTDHAYRKPPREEARGGNLYLFIDPAGGEVASDFTTLLVLKAGEDRVRYALDLWRERVDLVGFLDLVFEVHRRWSREGRIRLTWLEEFGAEGRLESLVREMDERSYRFPVRKLPFPRSRGKQGKRSKEGRIALLQPVIQRGDLRFPEAGFGHGGKSDPRDTFRQLVEDEYELWTPVPGSTLYDDMLDVLAWSVQPEVRLVFPTVVEAREPFDPHHPARRPRPRRRASAWVR